MYYGSKTFDRSILGKKRFNYANPEFDSNGSYLVTKEEETSENSFAVYMKNQIDAAYALKSYAANILSQYFRANPEEVNASPVIKKIEVKIINENGTVSSQLKNLDDYMIEQYASDILTLDPWKFEVETASSPQHVEKRFLYSKSGLLSETNDGQIVGNEIKCSLQFANGKSSYRFSISSFNAQMLESLVPLDSYTGTVLECIHTFKDINGELNPHPFPAGTVFLSRNSEDKSYLAFSKTVNGSLLDPIWRIGRATNLKEQTAETAKLTYVTQLASDIDTVFSIGKTLTSTAKTLSDMCGTFSANLAGLKLSK